MLVCGKETNLVLLFQTMKAIQLAKVGPSAVAFAVMKDRYMNSPLRL